MRDPTIQFDSDAEISRLHTPLLLLGHEKRSIDAPGWNTDCVTGPGPTIAFSLLPVRVAFAGQDPVVLAPTTLATPCASQEYTRTPLTAQGQRTVFFVFKDDTLARLTEPYDPSAADRPGHPVGFRDAPSDPGAMAAACALVRASMIDRTLREPVLIEDAAITIASRALGVAYSSFDNAGGPTKISRRSQRLQRDGVNAACAYIHTHVGERMSLDELSDIAELSPGYLSRIFPAHTGVSLSKYLLTARVTQALTRLPDYRQRLGVLARVCGFASHAHMTATFSSVIGRSPSALQTDELHDLVAHLRRAGTN